MHLSACILCPTDELPTKPVPPITLWIQCSPTVQRHLSGMPSPCSLPSWNLPSPGYFQYTNMICLLYNNHLLHGRWKEYEAPSSDFIELVPRPWYLFTSFCMFLCDFWESRGIERWSNLSKPDALGGWMATCEMMKWLVRQTESLMFGQTDREKSRREAVNLIGFRVEWGRRLGFQFQQSLLFNAGNDLLNNLYSQNTVRLHQRPYLNWLHNWQTKKARLDSHLSFSIIDCWANHFICPSCSLSWDMGVQI